ncbi:hypothetical protein JRC04_22980 [Mycolicibacterium sp. S2-37]|uniref:hypothetical protein n=1 Tax=Mycolicibacterium sp. S2-37 TaxID=2810297 RepID=UPI001A940C3D|nr:hypothetical protein [Mycolicibacterium sp. S2-37]MBO0680340.1 hypothetical protein [Mycolicibacterium sp. S2-37]
MSDTNIGAALIEAARLFDGTTSGAAATEAAVLTIGAPAHIVAAVAGWLARTAAGHLNSPCAESWNDADDAEADAIIDAAMSGIHHGGRRVGPNLPREADRAMTALTWLARERDDAGRMALAGTWSQNPEKALAVALAGVQFVRLLADMTGDAESAIDGLTVELMALATGGSVA